MTLTELSFNLNKILTEEMRNGASLEAIMEVVTKVANDIEAKEEKRRQKEQLFANEPWRYGDTSKLTDIIDRLNSNEATSSDVFTILLSLCVKRSPSLAEMSPVVAKSMIDKYSKLYEAIYSLNEPNKISYRTRASMSDDKSDMYKGSNPPPTTDNNLSDLDSIHTFLKGIGL